jgi:glycosyltransferase involved in cell wall biosynthesis
MRLAIVDLLFSWPPNGGADVDLYHVAAGLRRIGHDIKLFGVRDPQSWERGAFEPDALPFPSEKILAHGKALQPESLCPRIREAVDAFNPDAVLIADGFFLKPYVIQALAHYPLAARYYAYEAQCHKDILRFRNHASCPFAYHDTPDTCRACAFEAHAAKLKQQHPLAWLDEYKAARAYDPEYHALNAQAFQALDALIAYNPGMLEGLPPHRAETFIVSGGVNLSDFPHDPLADRPPSEDKIILMTGRGEDPAKGGHVLRLAAELLARERDDFEVWATMPEDSPATPYFRPIGWHPHKATRALYEAADIVVVPSVWDEPFGMVAVEAMAVGRPVCASRVGGLQTIIDHTMSGFLFERSDHKELAKQLSLLLDNRGMRVRMGRAGRDRVEDLYAWERVLLRDYLPILACLEEKRKGAPCA